MGSLNPQGDLAAASIAFFSPALLIGLYINLRHGFSKRLGWFYIVLLCIMRIIGASCILYIETQNDYSSGLITTAAIMNAAGTAPLLLALLGFLERINSDLAGSGKDLSHGLVFRPIHIISLAGLALAIAGGVEKAENISQPTSSAFKTGERLLQAAAILFLILYCLIAGINFLFFHHRHMLIPSERRLIYAGLPALPFLLVRMVYVVLIAFTTNPSSPFYFARESVWVEAFMRFLPEAVVVVLFVVAGLMTPKMQKEMVPEGKFEQTELEGGKVEQRQERSLGDYRPSRLVLNAYRQHQANRTSEA